MLDIKNKIYNSFANALNKIGAQLNQTDKIRESKNIVKMIKHESSHSSTSTFSEL